MAPLILGLKPGHDGAVAAIRSGSLLLSNEGEKDSGTRNDALSIESFLEAAFELDAPPDVLAVGGWYQNAPDLSRDIGAGYYGLVPGRFSKALIFGHEVDVYRSSHERSHIMCSVGMSPHSGLDDLVVLIWEGQIGRFYLWQDGGEHIVPHEVLSQPGGRYAALFGLSDAAAPDEGAMPPATASGKLMALAGLAGSESPDSDSMAVVDAIIRMPTVYPFNKRWFRRSALYNCGPTAPQLWGAARYMTDRLFGIFAAYAESVLPRGLPLVVGGGCGLNCEWNSRWRASGLFSHVFVPPCTNDSGSAIGSALDAQFQMGSGASLEWNVFSGPRFVSDCDPQDYGWLRISDEAEGSVAASAEAIMAGSVVAWVEGRSEIGPRSLGHRSLLASPSDPASKDRLNTIKRRESYRPIAPVTLEHEMSRWFDPGFADPHMLYFRRVLDTHSLPSVTHADGSARAQSVSEADSPILAELLSKMGSATGVPILCNTSLNFSGCGFINRTSDLIAFCESRDIDRFVVDGRAYSRCGAVRTDS